MFLSTLGSQLKAFFLIEMFKINYMFQNLKYFRNMCMLESGSLPPLVEAKIFSHLAFCLCCFCFTSMFPNIMLRQRWLVTIGICSFLPRNGNLVAFIKKLQCTTFPHAWPCGQFLNQGIRDKVDVKLSSYVQKRKEIPFISLFWLYLLAGKGSIIEMKVSWTIKRLETVTHRKAGTMR